ncbi:MAG: hypothetical protein GYB66_02505 [Chloroflexi bacterium]|nr:hypothetical protein [Chloroflexota bacterium]
MATTKQDWSPTEIGDEPAEMIVDPEHIGIRTMMPILAAIGLIGGYVLGDVVTGLIDETVGSLCTSIALALIGLVALTQFGERVIKPRWSSGRRLFVDRAYLTMRDKRRKPATETTMPWQAIKAQAWYFTVPTRKSRVPKGWFCTAVRLVQDDDELILYAFLKPEIAQEMPGFERWFTRLRDKKERETLANTDTRAASQQERYRRLEGKRWNDGAELTGEDFVAVMELVDQHATPMGQH